MQHVVCMLLSVVAKGRQLAAIIYRTSFALNYPLSACSHVEQSNGKPLFADLIGIWQ